MTKETNLRSSRLTVFLAVTAILGSLYFILFENNPATVKAVPLENKPVQLDTTDQSADWKNIIDKEFYRPVKVVLTNGEAEAPEPDEGAELLSHIYPENQQADIHENNKASSRENTFFAGK